LSFVPYLVSAKSIIVIRHAERLGQQDDLTPQGYARAKALSDMLVDEKVTLILSTNYKRTKKTVLPLAQKQGVDVGFYDTMKELKDQMAASQQGTTVIVGHSNTVPDIVSALAGESIPEIDESDFGHFYVITESDNGNDVSLLKLRY
jgi:2,3-bisphosphoglycerate-dependent phosphoglycerate mutase